MAKGLASRGLDKRRRAKARRYLLDMMSCLDDAPTMQLVWALNALQSDNPPKDIGRYLVQYPPEAASAQAGDAHFFLKWELESFLVLLLATPKSQGRMAGWWNYNTYSSGAKLINSLKASEEAEERVWLEYNDVRREMPRIAHRQFLWQRGFFDIEKMYRHYFVYGQGECAKFFENKYGLPIGEFAFGCILFYFQALRNAWHFPPQFPKEMTIRAGVVERTLAIISMDHQKLRALTTERISDLVGGKYSKLSYLPSTLRHYPIVSSTRLHGKIISPLPQLIIFRATSGLYYDLQAGHQTLLEEANDRFEEYTKRLLEARLPNFVISRDQSYGTKAQGFKTPDILVRENGIIRLVFECKATKLTYAAQYADDPYGEAPSAYLQIAKGISQLWRFFSRARRNIYNKEPVRSDAYGIVLTMDNWFQLSRATTPEVFAEAEKLVANDPEILLEDKRPVLFCSIEELDAVLAISNEEQFLNTLSRAHLPEHEGWLLSSVRHPYGSEEPVQRKSYPFNLQEVIPLWGTWEKEQEAQA